MPYQAKLDRGAIFYTALEPRRVLEQYYNMADRACYTFLEGNARFVVLDSHHLRDQVHLARLDTASGNTGTSARRLHTAAKHSDGVTLAWQDASRRRGVRPASCSRRE